MYKSSDIPLYQSEPLPSVINPEPNATIGCIRDTSRRERRIATGVALGATKREGEKAEVPKNPRHGAELLYGVGSAYEPPKMSLLPKFAGHSC